MYIKETTQKHSKYNTHITKTHIHYETHTCTHNILQNKLKQPQQTNNMLRALKQNLDGHKFKTVARLTQLCYIG